MLGFGKKKDDTPQYLKDIKTKVETMKQGDSSILIRSWEEKPQEEFMTDNLTVVIYRGTLDSRKVQDIRDVLDGVSTAHRRPGKTARKGNDVFGLVGR